MRQNILFHFVIFVNCFYYRYSATFYNQPIWIISTEKVFGNLFFAFWHCSERRYTSFLVFRFCIYAGRFLQSYFSRHLFWLSLKLLNYKSHSIFHNTNQSNFQNKLRFNSITWNWEQGYILGQIGKNNL